MQRWRGGRLFAVVQASFVVDRAVRVRWVGMRHKPPLPGFFSQRFLAFEVVNINRDWPEAMQGGRYGVVYVFVHVCALQTLKSPTKRAEG